MDRWSVWDTWLKQTEWPFVPAGFVLLMPALERIALTLFDGEWCGLEFGYETQYMANGIPHSDKAFSPGNHDEPDDFMLHQYGRAVWFWHNAFGPLAAVTPPTRAQWQQAYERFAYCFEHGNEMMDRRSNLCRRVQTLAACGELEFFARNQGSGDMLPLAAARWNCDIEIADLRFARGRVNLLKLMNPPPPEWKERREYLALMTSWLFVREDNLAAVLASLAPTPALAACKLTAQAESAAEKWLIEQFANGTTKKLAKADFRKSARLQFPGLSGRAFNRAWERAAKEFPERAMGGSRGNRRGEPVR